MKTLLLSSILIALRLIAPAQNFSGQWKGQFTDKSTSFAGWGGNQCDYTLELDCKGSVVTGYSYTYYNEGEKRYYTICRLKGSYNKASKYIEVTETERTKTNVPDDIRNCFQVHHLTYFKKDGEETLEGNWSPAPDQVGDCGFGYTNLTRKVLQKNTALFNKPVTTAPVIAKRTAPVKTPFRDLNKPTTAPVVKNIIKPKPTPVKPPVAKTPVRTPIVKAPVTTTPAKPLPVKPPVIVSDKTTAKTANPVVPPAKADSAKKPVVIVAPVEVKKEEPVEKQAADISLSKRNTELLETVEVDNPTFRVDLYDSGEIDGDSISLFFNGKLLLSHKRLGDKPITLTLNVDEKRQVNELVMYAENLGEIPPNTALMIVTDGEKRYEVRISSDLEKSGTIRFVHKALKGQ